MLPQLAYFVLVRPLDPFWGLFIILNVEEQPEVLYDYDKLVAESNVLYLLWWMMWKEKRFECALYPEEPMGLYLYLFSNLEYRTL